MCRCNASPGITNVNFAGIPVAGYFQRGSGGRQVADHAIERSAAKLNRCGFQNAVAKCNPSFDHLMEIRQNLKEPIKASVVSRGSINKMSFGICTKRCE